MEHEEREAQRERNRRRGGCSRCGSMAVRFEDGATLGPDAFAGIVYKVCPGCGLNEPTRRRPGRTK